jgi:dTDP-glucose 4,6-dehydratase
MVSGSQDNCMSKKYLVTGGAGFIGSNLVRSLVSDDDAVVYNLDKLTYAGNLSSLADLESCPGYHFIKADLCDLEIVRKVVMQVKPDFILHLAAESHVDRSIDSPGDFIQTNIVGTFNLLQASLELFRTLEGEARNRFRFLHVSTDEVFGSLSMTDPAFSELTPYSPRSPYSASKAGSDHLARAWQETYGLPVLVTNCSNNYGPFQFPEKLIPVVILKRLRGEKIPVYGKGENVRDWLYVEDHCRALKLVVGKGKVGEDYNIGGENEISNLELVRLICRLLDELAPSSDGLSHEKAIEFVTDRPGHDLRYSMNINKIRNELGWKPLESAESGFRKTVLWYLNRQEWWGEILEKKYQLNRLGGQH